MDDTIDVLGLFDSYNSSSSSTPLSSRLAQMLLKLKETDAAAFDKLMTPGSKNLSALTAEVEVSLQKSIEVSLRTNYVSLNKLYTLFHCVRIKKKS